MATTNKNEFKNDKEDLNRGQGVGAKSETGGIVGSEGAGWERSESDRKAGEPGVTTGGLSRIKGGKSGIEEAKSDFAAKSSQVLEKAQTVVTDFARNAGDKASVWAGNAKDIASQAGDNVATMVRRYPVASVFAGFGVGFLFALLIPRRR